MSETTKVHGIYYATGHGGDGTGVRFMSDTSGVVVDLISEGEVEGLVSGEFTPNASNVTGTLGYQQGVTFNSFYPLDHTNETGFLASVYWNETPVFDKDSFKFNFTNIDLDTNRANISSNGLDSRRTTIVSEELRGRERKTGGSTIEYVKYPKYYTVNNKYCNKITVNLTAGGLGKTDRDPGTKADPNLSYGQTLDSTMVVRVDYRAKYTYGSNLMFDLGEVVIFQGALSSTYARSITLDLPLADRRDEEGRGDFIGWEVRVTKETDEPTTTDVKNSVLVDNIVEEIDDRFIYPKSYVVRNHFDAQNFSSIPERAYDMRLSKVKIPSNYDAITKTYAGNWDGTFSTEATGAYGNVGGSVVGASRPEALHWTDNPAWCFYDLVTNRRYGLGKYIDASTLDKWSLYEIGQYCDELVKNHNNEVEPRFACNIIIQNRTDAFQVLSDMVSVFRGIIYYNGGNLYAVQDSFKEAIYQFNNTNVVNGEFKYSSTSAKVRHTVAVVRYNDKDNKFVPATEYVEDIEGIRKYGIKEKSISAFGCTSKSQAQRMGRWILSTEAHETETIAFTAGQEGAILRPGDVFSISDTNRLMTRRGGRIKALNRISDSEFDIYLDSTLKGGKYWDANQGAFLSKDKLDHKTEYLLTLSTPSFYYDTSQVEIGNSSETVHVRNKQIQTFSISPNTIQYSIPESGSKIRVSGNLLQDAFSTSGFSGEALWGISTSGVSEDTETFFETLNQEQKYRVINISEKDEGKYDIAGAEYAEVKYTEIDRAVTPVNQINFEIPNSPASINNLVVRSLAAEGAPNTRVIEFDIGKSTSASVSYYQAYIKKSSTVYPTESDHDSSVKIYSTNSPSASFIPASDGTYRVTVYAYNSLGQSNASYGSAYKSAAVAGVNPIRDVKISHLSLDDDLGGGSASSTSDPTTAGTIDQYDGSNNTFKWQTTIPKYQGANIAIDFSYQVKIFANKYSVADGDVTYTTDNYRPPSSELAETTFAWDLGSRYTDMISSSDPKPYDKVYRKYTIKVVAQNPDLSTSEGTTEGVDFLYVNNTLPSVPASDGLIDINNHLKIFNLDRPPEAKYAYIFSAPTSFAYSDWRKKNNDGSYTRPDIELTIISADVNVFDVRPSYITDDLRDAHFFLAYVDQFDLDLDALALANGDKFDLVSNPNGVFDLSKALTDRVQSAAIHIEKVTPEVLDLIGEGWKAWVKIDIDGKWYGRGIACVKDVTSEYTNYAGYLPFYCTLKSPSIFMHGGQVRVGTTYVGKYPDAEILSTNKNFQMGCGYYIKEGDESSYPANVSTKDIVPIGGYTAETYDPPGDDTPNYPQGFKRYRIYFEKKKDPTKYWVMGMNARNESYYDDTFINGVKGFFDPSTSITPTWANEFRAGAYDAYEKAKEAGSPYEDKQLAIGGSDAYFNFHPAGFVQGFGGLPKSGCYFDVHMGHMVDRTYLDQAMFFVMATDQTQKNLDPNPPCAGNLPANCE